MRNKIQDQKELGTMGSTLKISKLSGLACLTAHNTVAKLSV